MVMPDNRSTPWTFVLTEPLRILVVDDDPILREFASVYLSTPSTTIDTACDGAEARIRLRQAAYDMLLLDIEMPHLDGFTLLEEIRLDEKMRHLPVVMLTGRDDIASIDRAYQVGADSFATKPVNWRQLSYQIRYVIRTSQAQSPKSDSSDPMPESNSIKGNVPDFLQSIICRADALERQLSANDREQFWEQIVGIRSSAQRALAAYSGMDGSAADCVEVADRRGGEIGDRTLLDRRSTHVVQS
jgi:DNA-binding response OmpR family regulator